MEKSSNLKNKLQKNIAHHYASGYEDERLDSGRGQLEFERTRELLKRFLPPAPAKIIDIGGGTGVYSFWLASLGYEVHLIDIVPLHIEIAKRKLKSWKDNPVSSITVGDARSVSFDDKQFDAALLFGPLYHLTNQTDREKTLNEVYRLLKNGGVLMAAGISRFASLLDGIRGDFLTDPDFQKIVKQDLINGQHRNPTGKQQYFMDTFFHHPDELIDEIKSAGFKKSKIIAIEGPCWLHHDLNKHFENITMKKALLSFISLIESDKAIIGASAHMMGIAEKIENLN